jgi:stage IV sporulation protein A
MEQFQVYQDIQSRTGGDIYIGVVGPVRTGKSTFIRHFMELVALPQRKESEQAEIRDQLPLSGSGKMITTVEPKFIPREAIPVTLGDQQVRIRMIDCVGYLVKDAQGNVEDGKERMVKTPWSKKAVPFAQAASEGTGKVIEEHATIGLLVTCDGSFGELPRENYLEAEALTAEELKKHGKPFLILLNSQHPHKEETKELAKSLEEKYGVSVLAVNCEQLRKEDITKILEKILYEFPLSEIRFYLPKWFDMLPYEHVWKQEILDKIREIMRHVRRIRDITEGGVPLTGSCVKESVPEELNLADGTVRVRVQLKEFFYFQMLSEMSGVHMENEYDLVHTMKELSQMKDQYTRVAPALEAVRGCGYGVVLPRLEEIRMEEPALIRQGNKYGVKIRSKSPSIHMIRADIETEIAPIVGTEQQANDLIAYIRESGERGESVWETNIFGKSLEELFEEGIRTKISAITEESQSKLQDTMQKIVNDSKGGLVCIII